MKDTNGLINRIKIFLNNNKIAEAFMHLDKSMILIVLVNILLNEIIYKGLQGFSAKNLLLISSQATFIIFLLSIINIFTRRIKLISYIGIVIVQSLYMASYVKFRIVGVALALTEVFQANEAANIKLQVSHETIRGMVLFVILGVLTIICIGRLVKGNLLMFRKSIPFFSILLVLSTISLCIIMNEKNLQVQKVGVLNTFFVSPIAASNKPVFNPELIDLEMLKDISSQKSHDLSDEAPNVILYMSEAFFDINKLPHIKFNTNPMYFYDELKKESVWGNLDVPTHGGGTSNVEFEVLTGLPIETYFNDWHIAYTNEVKKPIASLASIFRNQGYKSIGVHSYMNWYYNRNTVYKLLGFDEFISLEYMNNSEYKGNYPSDDRFVDYLINKFENTKGRKFIYGISTQSHGPYFNRYGNDVRLEKGISVSSDLILDTYAQGAYDANAALEKLVNYLRKIDQKTILIFFGDHLPMFGDNYLAYRESGFIGKSGDFTVGEFEKMYSPPYIIWANYDVQLPQIGDKSIFMFSNDILKLAGVDAPNYYKIYNLIAEEYPIISRRYIKNKAGKIFEPETKEYNDILELIKAVHMDIMYGDMTIEDEPEKWVVSDNDNYCKEINSIEIKQCTEIGERLIIKGKNLYKNSTLLVNGKNVEFEFVDDESITIPTSDLKVGSNTLRLELLDNQNSIIAKSAEFIYR